MGGLDVHLGEAGPDIRMFKRGWTINLFGGRPKQPAEKPAEKPKKRK